jgi:hypothetical protein
MPGWVFMRNNVCFVKILSLFIAIALLAILLFTELLHNTARLIASRGYFIPQESSIFTFAPVLENDGSGEWWLYGEDHKNYYCSIVAPYIFIEKNNQCPAFDKLNYKTWCFN